MMRQIWLWCVSALLVLLPGAAFADGPFTVAVAAFENNSGDARFDPLGKGLADMMVTDLSRVEALQLVERERLNELLAELELADTGFLDAATAQQMGRGLGAQYVLTGSFASIDPNMRIDVRLIAVESAEIVTAEEITGPVDEFFLLEKELVGALIDSLGIELSTRDTVSINRVATESFDAVLSYAAGLDALDRGEMAQARDALAAALEADDGFTLANSLMDSVSERLAASRAARTEALNGTMDQLMAAVDEYEAAGWEGFGGFLEQNYGMLLQPDWARKAFALGERLVAAELSEEVRGTRQSVNEMALLMLIFSANSLRDSATVLSYGPTYLEQYPASMYATSVTSFVQLMLDREQKRSTGAEPAAAEAMAEEAEYWTRVGSMARYQRGIVHAAALWAEGMAWRAEHNVPDDLEVLDDWFDILVAAGDWETAATLPARGRALDQYASEPEGWERKLERHQSDIERLGRWEEDCGGAALSGELRDCFRYIDEIKDLGRLTEARDLYESLGRRQSEFETRQAHEWFGERITLALMLNEQDRAQAIVAEWEAAAADSEIEVASGYVRQVRERAQNLQTDFTAEHQGWRDISVAHVYQRYNQFEDCVRITGRFLERDNGTPDQTVNVLQMRASCQLESSQFDEARATYERLISDFSGNPMAAAAGQLINMIPR